jgi:hypothetical protein
MTITSSTWQVLLDNVVFLNLQLKELPEVVLRPVCLACNFWVSEKAGWWLVKNLVGGILILAFIIYILLLYTSKA